MFNVIVMVTYRWLIHAMQSRSAYYSVRSLAEWVVLIFEDKDQSCEVSVCKFPAPFALAIFHTCLRE